MIFFCNGLYKLVRPDYPNSTQAAAGVNIEILDPSLFVTAGDQRRFRPPTQSKKVEAHEYAGFATKKKYIFALNCLHKIQVKLGMNTNAALYDGPDDSLKLYLQSARKKEIAYDRYKIMLIIMLKIP
jgi:hypothetical protein